jgi:NADH-quinone oxidoreductase subunit M
MPESDLTWLSLLVFLPSAFAVGLLAIPSKWPEAMRWWALFGTAGTLSLSPRAGGGTVARIRLGG